MNAYVVFIFKLIKFENFTWKLCFVIISINIHDDDDDHFNSSFVLDLNKHIYLLNAKIFVYFSEKYN